jgi:hypothetical protein
MNKVAALYIDKNGPYPALLGPELCWDEARDARTYAGPCPVVAHPPCGPWTAYAHLCKQDPQLAVDAVCVVRRWGGVLEHPAKSRLWGAPRLNLPRPGELPDAWGGLTFEVDQLEWGHACQKRTWIYAVGLVLRGSVRLRGPLVGARPSHVMGRDRRRWMQSPLPEASHEIRRRTPPAFAEWLISLAATAQVGA